MSGDDLRPPRPAWGIYKRAALASVLIIISGAAAVSTAALLKVKDITDTIKQFQGHVHFDRNVITKAEAGQPQTILLVGTDRRYGQAKSAARSDTLMLLHLDPSQQATGVLSIPRDLLVTIPGYGLSKINAAYADGGLNLTVKTVKALLSTPEQPFKINHAIGVDFKGFRRAVDYIGCVYADVDRRYYHSNLGLPPAAQYAEIDIQPGYQRLCGQRALDYVRYRHTDSTFVRDARQQDFLREAKDQVGTSQLIDDLEPLVKIFAKATEADNDLASNHGILRLLKLAAFSTGHPTREVPFPRTLNGTKALGSYVTIRPDQIVQIVDQFMHGKVVTAPPKPKPAVAAKKKKRKKKSKANLTPFAKYGLVDATRRGEDLAVAALAPGGGRPHLRFPFYYTSGLTPSGIYPASAANAPMPRVYTIRDRAGRAHQAYRIVIQQGGGAGQYYGVQGTTWRTPPLLKSPSERRRMRGRTYDLYYDGKLLRAVAWRTPRAVYWVSNTLSLALTNQQMLGLGRSLTRFGS